MALGPTEITVLIVVVVLLFGATAIPKLARSLGTAKGEFQKAKSEFDDELRKGEDAVRAEPAPAAVDGPSDEVEEQDSA